MSEGPLVSILTPCFEHEPYLKDYFDSLLEQTYHPLELIFFDDASGDRSWEIATSYREKLQQRFQRVVLHRHEKNLGLIPTLQNLRREMQGDIVCILESDDYFYSTKIEENVRFLQAQPGLGLVHSDIDFLDMRSQRLQRARWGSAGRNIPEGEVFDDLLQENFILTCAMACRASLFREHVDFEGYQECGYRTADYPMFLDLSRQTPFGYIDRSLAVYRVVEGSISHPQNEIGQLQWKLDYYKIKQDYMGEYPCRPETRRRADRQLHRCWMQLGWASGSAEMFDRGHAWFQEHQPEHVATTAQRFRKRVLRHRALWRWSRRLEAWRLRGQT